MRKRVSGPLGQIERTEDFPFSKSFFYFVFKTKFNYEPNANSNRVSNILFNSNKMDNFGRLPKINFTPF